MRPTIAGCTRTMAVLASLILAGCAGTTSPPTDAGPGASPQDWVPADVVWDTNGSSSKPLEAGPFDVLPVETAMVDSFDRTRISTATWRPAVPADQKVPVLLDVGPYFGDTIEQPLRGSLYVDGMVPHGFAYGQVAVRGTSSSGGCQELFSLNEQKDIDALVTYYGTQPWSNGNVALTGLSYDGTTAWIGAQFGNPHLKTIIPVSGLTSIYEHSFRNGTAWLTAPYLHTNYWLFGFQTDDRTAADKVENVLCPEFPRGVATAGWSTVTGDDEELPPFDGYWAERDFRPGILENYEGSIFYVNGLRDWRVPPHMGFPFLDAAQERGIDTKILLGQWWHNMPDTASLGDGARWDYAEMLLRWLQRYLYEDPTVNTGPAVHVSDDQGAWRTEEDWPPADASWTPLHLGDGVLAREETPTGQAVIYGPGNAHELAQDEATAPDPVLEYRATTGPLDEALRFAGLPQLHVTFIPSSPEGHRVYAELLEGAPDGTERHVGHAVMDLRYHHGGSDRHTLTPGEPIVARMEFLPLDAHIPTGSELVLRIVGGATYSEERLNAGSSGYLDQFLEGPTPVPFRIAWGDGASTLNVPTIHRDVGDGTYPGQP